MAHICSVIFVYAGNRSNRLELDLLRLGTHLLGCMLLYEPCCSYSPLAIYSVNSVAKDLIAILTERAYQKIRFFGSQMGWDRPAKTSSFFMLFIIIFHQAFSSRVCLPLFSENKIQIENWIVWCQKESWIFLMVLTLSVLGGWDSCTRWTAKRDFWIRLFGVLWWRGNSITYAHSWQASLARTVFKCGNLISGCSLNLSYRHAWDMFECYNMFHTGKHYFRNEEALFENTTVLRCYNS